MELRKWNRDKQDTRLLAQSHWGNGSTETIALQKTIKICAIYPDLIRGLQMKSVE